MKTLNFIKRKRRGAGRAQPGPDETVGGKVCAPHTQHDRSFAPFRIRVRCSPTTCDVSQTHITHWLRVGTLVSAPQTLSPHPEPPLAATGQGSSL